MLDKVVWFRSAKKKKKIVKSRDRLEEKRKVLQGYLSQPKFAKMPSSGTTEKVNLERNIKKKKEKKN